MQYTVAQSIEILERTPDVLAALVQNLSADWTSNNEGGDSWNAYDIVGHLIHGERTDWIPRMEIILSDVQNKTFEPFDRFAQFKDNKGRTLTELLDEFRMLRRKNLAHLRAKNLTESNLKEKGIHPALGEVTLSQLLSTWTAHDLDHVAQISRVMAKQYATEVGPWREYLRILQS